MSRFVVTDIDGDRSGIGEEPYDRGSIPLGQRDAGDRRMTRKQHLHQRTEVPDAVATCLLWNCRGKESGLGVADSVAIRCISSSVGCRELITTPAGFPPAGSVVNAASLCTTVTSRPPPRCPSP